jgi:hypothetical protein
MVGKITLNNSRYKYHNKGFTSIVNEIIGLSKIHYSKWGNYKVIVEDTQVLELFENIYTPEETDIFYDVSDIFFRDFDRGNFNNLYNAHTLVNIEDIKTKKVSNILKLKPTINRLLETTKKTIIGEDKYVGLQIRGTDKSTEIPIIEIENVYRHIDKSLLFDDEIKKVFLSTYDIYYREMLLKKYGNDVIIFNQNNLISYDNKPIHKKNDRKRVNFEVMSDVYILSKCDYLLYCFSNVSFLALSMMNDYNKKIININN